MAEEKTALEYLEVALRYLSAAAAEDVTPETVNAALQSAFRDERGVMMAGFVEKWIEEGRQEGLQVGRQEGRQEGLEESVLRVLERRFAQVPAAISAQLQSLDVETLELALDEALAATDLPDFVRRLELLGD